MGREICDCRVWKDLKGRILWLWKRQFSVLVVYSHLKDDAFIITVLITVLNYFVKRVSFVSRRYTKGVLICQNVTPVYKRSKVLDLWAGSPRIKFYWEPPSLLWENKQQLQYSVYCYESYYHYWKFWKQKYHFSDFEPSSSSVTVSHGPTINQQEKFLGLNGRGLYTTVDLVGPSKLTNHSASTNWEI